MTHARAVLVAVALLGLACGDDLPSGAQDGTGTGSGETSGGNQTVPAMICTPGERVCGSAEVLVCADDGARWGSEPCGGGEVCLDGACQADALSVTTEYLEPATIGFMYAATLSADGGAPPYAWTAGDGELPPGLAMSPDGAVTGMPTTTGDYVFEARVEDSVGATAARSFAMTVHSEPLTIITLPKLGTFDEGMPMHEPLLALGGTEPYGWFMIDGTLPEGVIVDAAGALTGTPLEPGPFDFRIRVVDAQRPPGWDEQDFSMQVELRPLSVVGDEEYDLLVFTVIVLPLLAVIPAVEVPYSTQLEADGGLVPYTWSEEPLPAGLDVIIPQAGVPADLVLSPSGELSGSVSNTDQVVTVPLIGAGVDLTGFFFYAEVSDSQAPPETAGALFLIPTLPI